MALGPLTFLAEFLGVSGFDVAGLFARWRDGCSLVCTSPNARKVVDVLGTWFRSILDEQRRGAQVIRE